MNEQKSPLRLLLVEDQRQDAELIVAALGNSGYALDVTRVQTEPEYCAALDRAPDVVLCDHVLPGFDSARALELLRTRGLDIPFIIVSGKMGEELAVEAMRQGADDYILKDRPARLGTAVAAALERRRAGSAARAAAQELRELQERQQRFLDCSPSLIFIKDPAGRYLHVNRAYERVIGKPASEVLGRCDEEIFPPELAAIYRADDRAVLASGKPMDFEESAMCSGVLRTFSVVKFPLSGGGDAGRSLGGIATDITEYIEIEQRFRASFEQAAVGIAHTALDWRFLMVNDKFCQMTGYSREELLAMRSLDLMHPDETGGGVRQRLLLENGLQTYSSERRYVRKDGSVLWVSNTVSLVRDAAGQPDYFLRVVEDVTERKRAQQRAALLQETALAIAGASDTASALASLLRIICESTGWDYGRAWLPDPGRTRLDSAATWHRGGAAFEAFDRENRTMGLELDGTGVAVPVFMSRRASVVRELRHADFRRRESAVAAGFQAWVGIPVSAGDDTVALLEFFLQSTEKADSNLVELVSVVATQLGALFQRKAAEEASRESEAKFRQLAENIPEVFWMTDEESAAITYVSPAFEKLTGRRDAREWLEAVHPDDRDTVRREWMRKSGFGEYDMEFRMVHLDGTERWVHTRAFPVREERGTIRRYAGITEDITERKRAHERLLQLAHYDHLTSLPNRVLFYDRLKQALAQARRNDWTSAVLLVDLDRFKNVNDTLGHAGGDRLLQMASERLTGCVRSGDTVGRLGGDEFGVILGELSASQDAGVVAQGILNALAEPFRVDGHEVYVTASVGIAIYPSDGDSVDTLVRDADTAMYSAKAAGRNVYRYYTAEMNERALEKMQLEAKLRRAIDREEFLLHLQPKVTLSTGEIAGFEALLRWNCPESGLVAPDRFIPLLEETGLIVPVGEWVLRAACAQLKTWKDAHARTVPIAVNLSSRQFHQVDLCATVKKILQEHAIAPGLLELEITESAAMQDAESSIAMLRDLKTLGVRLSIDDFGTGYSSLSYLKRLPLDTVKIDRSFVTDLATNPDDASIAQAIINMAHNLGLKVVAEGVEDASQLSFLTAHACDEIQGYYFSRPVVPAEATAMLADNRRLQRPRAGESDDGERTLLLLDDEENVLASLKRLLRRDGYRILTATGAQAAFEILATHKVGVIVSDQRMPGTTGVEFLRRVKELYPDSVRMVLSGFTDLDSVTDAINQGAIYRFLTKPWDDNLLRAHIAEAFRRYAGIREGARQQQASSAKLDELARANVALRLLLEERNAAPAAACPTDTAPSAQRIP